MLNTFISKKTWILLFCVIIATIPRFNRNQFFISRPPADMAIHTAMIEYYRTGEVDNILLSKHSIAANWRPLFPFIASFLPFAPITSLSILGILSIFFSVIILKRIMRQLGVDEKNIYLSLYLYIFSFPVFYYTTIGYLDPGLILLLNLGILLAIEKHTFLFYLNLALGVLMKEGIIVLLPFYWLYIIKEEAGTKKTLISIILSILIYFTISVIVRKLTFNSSLGFDVFWSPGSDMFLYNLNRINSWLSFILVMGIPLALISYNFHIFKTLIKSHQGVLPLIAGALMAVSTYGFAFISTVADGRTTWASYPFLFPIIGLIFTNKDRIK